MKEFILNNWGIIASVLGVIFAGSFKTSRKVFSTIFKAAASVLFTEDYIMKVVLWGLEALAKKTTNKVDDELIKDLKDKLEESKK